MKISFILITVLLSGFISISIQAQIINTIGGGATTYCDGCPATTSIINSPCPIAIDKHGNIYITDITWGIGGGSKIRKISASGIITTYAGSDTCGYRGDGGPATIARLSTRIYGLAVDTNCNLYISDYDNSVIRKVDTAGIITTFVTAPDPFDIAADLRGNIYYSRIGFAIVNKIDASGTVSNYAGNLYNAGYTGDGGAATAAWLERGWKGLAVDSSGNLYISDYGNKVIRKVNTAGIISTIAGGDTSYADGIAATSAALTDLQYLACDLLGNVYITDHKRLRKVNTAGIITTVAGDRSSLPTVLGDGGPATNAFIWGAPLNGVAIDAHGDFYITSEGRVRKIFNSTLGTDNTVKRSDTLSFFPNPADKVVTIKSSGSINHLELANILGQVILIKDSNTEIVALDVSDLVPGIYYLKAYNAQVLRFVKE